MQWVPWSFPAFDVAYVRGGLSHRHNLDLPIECLVSILFSCSVDTFIIQSMPSRKRNDDACSRHPCLTPVRIEKASESWRPWITLQIVSSYEYFTVLYGLLIPKTLFNEVSHFSIRPILLNILPGTERSVIPLYLHVSSSSFFKLNQISFFPLLWYLFLLPCLLKERLKYIIHSFAVGLQNFR